jgi:hypothetical protein
MGRPTKPPVGTAERLQTDLADYGPTWRFICDHIKRAGGVHIRGNRHRAINEAAKEFGIDYKTAERHFERIRRFDNQEGMKLLASGLVVKYAPVVDEAMRVIRAAFSPTEMDQLGAIGSDLVLQLAKERLELIELRKRRKRK